MKAYFGFLRFLLLISLVFYVLSCSKNNPDPIETDEEIITDTIIDETDDNDEEVIDTTNVDVNDEPDTIPTDSVVSIDNLKDTLFLSFQYGEDGPSSSDKNLYVVWLESSDFIQNIFVCKRLLDGSLTGTALPYWKINKYPKSSKSEVDAVTAATIQNVDFTLSAVLKNNDLKKFKVCFETDRSFDENDWFSNQPAILYSANIDLTDTVSEVELLPVGWTPNEYTDDDVENTPIGQLQSELRYVTHHQNDGSFGAVDSRGATKMVKKITVTVK